MKKLIVLVAVLFLFAGAFAAQTFAAAGQEKGTMGQSQAQSQGRMEGAIKISELMNKNIKGQQGEQLGKVEDVVIGEQGRVSYVILAGEQDKLYPIPVQAINKGAKADEFTASISKDQLKNAPSFAKNEWPDLAQPQWEQRVFSYYGEQVPGGASQPGMQMQPGLRTPQSGMQQPSPGARTPQ